MFWKLSFKRPSAIDAILDKEDCTLGEILDEDDVLQECKSHNKKLIDFLVRPEIMEGLVKLVSQEPSQGVEDKVKFKYPHIACELLTSEVFTITEHLSKSENLLTLLWSFLECTTALNPLIGSFISKVLAMLLNKEPTVIFSYMCAREDFLSQFLLHLGTSAIMDLLLQMVAVGETDQIRQDIAIWLKEQGLVEKLVDLIGRESNTDYCANASQALCDMYILSRESFQKGNPAPLLDTLESESTLRRLLDNMFCSETPRDIVIVNGISVLLTALERRPMSMITPTIGQSFTMTNPEDDPEHPFNSCKELTAELERCLSSRLKDFHDLLERRPEGYSSSVMHTSAGDLDPPLGNTRLHVARLFASVLQCGSSSISRAMMELGTFSSLLDLFFQYPWNNFLHKEIEICVGAALNSSSPYPNNDQTTTAVGDKSAGSETSEETPDSSETNPKSLRHHLLADCKLVCRILDGFEMNERLSKQSRGHRQGYMGHLLRITNSLVRCGEGDEMLREALRSSMDENTQEQWNNFIVGPIAELNKRNEINLGGNPPLSSGIDDSDEEFDQLGGSGLDSELEKAYQQYQDVKYVSQFMDDCGVEDELNPNEEPFEASFSRLMDLTSHIDADENNDLKSPDLFEAACHSRIQQFDDSDESEEEDDTSTWTDKEVSLTSPMEHNSASSDDEDNFTRKEFQTGSSDDDDGLSKRAAVYLTTPSGPLAQITSTVSNDGESDKMEIGSSQGGIISWHSELASEVELSGRGVNSEGEAGLINWITQPMSGLRKSQQSRNAEANWADFSSAFPDSSTSEKECLSPQEMDLDAGPVSSHITVTYKTRAGGESPCNDDDIIESPQHRPNKANYSLLSPSGAGDLPDSSSSPLNTNAIHVDVDSSSDEEGANSSSDSDDERSGKYTLNASSSSEGDSLIQRDEAQDQSSLSDGTSQQTGPPDSTSANGSGTPDKETSNSLEPSEAVLSNSEASAEDRLGESGGMNDVEELQENFGFLSKQGMLSANTSSNNNSLIGDSQSEEERRKLIEQKRAEAMQACEQFEQVQAKQNQRENSLET